jgi:RNA polymerase sigma-70 factor (ECF subfamily)
MLQVRAGDAASFEVLLLKHRAPVISYLTRMVGNQAVAEELAQEVFLRVYRASGRYEASAKFTTWLYRIATRLALNSIRNGRREKYRRSLDETRDDRLIFEPADDRRNREEQLLAEARFELIRQAIAELPEKQRAAVLMHKYQELDYTQIAAALGCSASAVKSLLFRAYETLRGRLRAFSLDGRGQKR